MSQSPKGNPLFRRLPIILLACWIVFQTVSYGVWINRTQRLSIVGDSLWYQVYALEIQQMLSGRLAPENVRMPVGPAGLLPVLGLRANYPNLYHLLIAASFSLFSPSLQAALYTGMPFLMLLFVGLFLLGRRLADDWVGLLAAVFAGMIPGLLGIARSSELYHPTAALIPFLFLLLLATDYFRKPLAAAGLGVLTGIAILIKGQVMFFVGLPYLLFVALGLWSSLRRGNLRDAGRVLGGGLLTLTLLLLVSAPWWLPNFSFLTMDLVEHTAGHYLTGTGIVDDNDLPYQEMTAAWTWSWAIKYALITVDELTVFGAALFAALLAGLLVFRRRSLLLPLLWVFAPYAIFTFISGMHHDRYYFPAFGGMALIAAMGVRHLSWRPLRFIIVCACLAGFLLTVWPRSVGPDRFPEAARFVLADSKYLHSPDRATFVADGLRLEPILKTHPQPGMKYINWLMPEQMATQSSKLIPTFELMKRSADRMFFYELPTRNLTSPLTAEQFRMRVNTQMVWDEETPKEYPEAIGYQVEHGLPVVLLADDRRLPVAGLWEQSWLADTEGLIFLGAAHMEFDRVLIWVFAKPVADSD